MPQGTPHSLTHAVTWLNLPSVALYHRIIPRVKDHGLGGLQ